ncbi:MAG TPA: pyridoxal-phosphate dependent enzyme [Chitinophagaceae bacterium]|nr:pyridoxal-phosphate dependent enzyme [Chitinophagaceae bacterium]
MEEIELRRIKDEVPHSILKHRDIRADVLRLDLIDPLVSGNKWYKLKNHLNEAASRQLKTIVTFGGAYSNHIVATAAACRMKGFRSIGIIRGEAAKQLSPSLSLAGKHGMELIYISREAYKRKEVPNALIMEPYYLIPEGGYGSIGMEGAKDILALDTQSYTHIITPVGTGTTIAGLIEASLKEQHVIGISALKNNHALQEDINYLLSPGNKNRFTLEHNYHFGGYAKKTNELIDFMNEWFAATGLRSDFVYTGKMFYAFRSLCEQSFFSPASNILLIHTGGLQGNMSLPKGTLIF